VTDWNFTTFEKYINRRLDDLASQFNERLVAAEKAVNTAFVSSEKAVDKAEKAQQLRNEAQNEFRQSLSDLSGLMWTIKEGQAAIESLRREMAVEIGSLSARLSIVEAAYANLQGRIWAVSALFAIIALGVSIGVRFIHA
jgi:hypothetical protein